MIINYQLGTSRLAGEQNNGLPKICSVTHLVIKQKPYIFIHAPSLPPSSPQTDQMSIFHECAIRTSLRKKYRLKSRHARLREAGLLTAKEMARKLKVSTNTIRDCYEKTCNSLIVKDLHSFFDRHNIGPNLSDFALSILQ